MKGGGGINANNKSHYININGGGRNSGKCFHFPKWVIDLDWRILLLLFSSFSLLILYFSSSYGGSFEFFNFSSQTRNGNGNQPAELTRKDDSFISQTQMQNRNQSAELTRKYNSFNSKTQNQNQSAELTRKDESFSSQTQIRNRTQSAELTRKDELNRSRIAVCLVGGARRFELTGPSIIDRVLNEFPNSDLFLNSPLDSNSYKLSLLTFAPRVNSIRIFKPTPIPESESQIRVLTAANSPNGIQGLLQYFNLVEGCLTMIEDYQKKKEFTYDWIVRTRVDGYWSAPLNSYSFIPGQYVVPPGSTYGGLNDRLGIGDYNTSIVALSRLSLIPTLDALNYTELNSETAFKAQLLSHNVSFLTPAQPFCIVSDRKYSYPPSRFGVPVATLSSHGPLSGAKCRPCKPVCVGPCVAEIMLGLSPKWSWTPWRNGTLELCDAHDEWETGWEKIFDKSVGKKLAQFRKRVVGLNVEQCVKDFKLMKGRAFKWDTPPLEEICKIGLKPKQL
ncbi:uncharacterized protein LOC130810343 [Amaranthus tricolor]|uniref:uncharacterized protein LOC130810343 n=1 Tax=Amaranthus tricolor TaxID=29722 RepID=UPI00258512BC|nr:uncharacterized protein LOC130810343 [Amaranthus tricolor]